MQQFAKNCVPLFDKNVGACDVLIPFASDLCIYILIYVVLRKLLLLEI